MKCSIELYVSVLIFLVLLLWEIYKWLSSFGYCFRSLNMSWGCLHFIFVCWKMLGIVLEYWMFMSKNVIADARPSCKCKQILKCCQVSYTWKACRTCRIFNYWEFPPCYRCNLLLERSCLYQTIQVYTVDTSTHWWVIFSFLLSVLCFVLFALSTVPLTLVLLYFLQNNTDFAMRLEPGNKELRSYAGHVASLRSKGLPTVSFVIALPCYSLWVVMCHCNISLVACFNPWPFAFI